MPETAAPPSVRADADLVREYLTVEDSHSPVPPGLRYALERLVRHADATGPVRVGDQLHNVEDLRRCGEGTWLRDRSGDYAIRNSVTDPDAEELVAWSLAENGAADPTWPVTVLGVPGQEDHRA